MSRFAMLRLGLPWESGAPYEYLDRVDTLQVITQAPPPVARTTRDRAFYTHRDSSY